MNYIDFFSPLVTFGFPTAIIGIVCGVIFYFVDKFLPDKIKFVQFLPFAFGILCYFLYDAIFITHKVTFSQEIISCGLCCGGIGVAVFTFIKNLKSEELNKSSIFMITKEILLGGLCESDAVSLAKIIDEKSAYFTQDNLLEDILSILKERSDILTEKDAKTFSLMIYHSIKPYISEASV